MRFDIITIFPNLFDSFLRESLIAKAQKKGLLDIRVHNLRDWAKDKHKTADDRPYGGGPGMILKVEPIYRALCDIVGRGFIPRRGRGQAPALHPKTKTILLDPAGKQFDQRLAEKFSKYKRLVLLCGRYEGFDHRVTKFVDERISIGPYVLGGGEVPAMVLTEAVSRLLPGFVGKADSLKEETFAKQKLSTFDFRLSTFVEYPQYTRPETFKYKVLSNKYEVLRVPTLLLSGNHKKIREWRLKHSK